MANKKKSSKRKVSKEKKTTQEAREDLIVKLGGEIPKDPNSPAQLVKGDIKKYVTNQAVNPFSDITRADSGANGAELAIVEPSFDPHKINMLINVNDLLKQLIRACRVNTVGNGWSLEYIGKDDEREVESIIAEKDKFNDLISNPSQLMTGQEMLNAIADDYFSQGRSYLEVSRAPDMSNEIICLYQIPACTMRKTRYETNSVTVDQVVRRRGREFTAPLERNFKRFVQKPETELPPIYFKEMGDPRIIDKRTGIAEEDLEEGEESKVAKTDKASEVIEIADYEAGHVYAMPLWVNQITKILGSKLADDVNMSFFENNMIPSMIIGVSGGMATNDTMDRIQKKFADFAGVDSKHKIMFLEFAGDPDSSSEDGNVPRPEVIFKDLSEAQQNDAIFKEFKEEVNKSLMSAFRIPPIVLGLSSDYTESTARVAILMAESQVFKPARNLIESYFNNHILVDEETGLPSNNWRFKLNATNIFNEEGVLDAIKVGAETGALTPNDIITILNSNLSLGLKSIDEAWGNLPANVSKDLFKSHLAALEQEGKGIKIPKLDEIAEEVEIQDEE